MTDQSNNEDKQNQSNDTHSEDNHATATDMEQAASEETTPEETKPSFIGNVPPVALKVGGIAIAVIILIAIVVKMLSGSSVAVQQATFLNLNTDGDNVYAINGTKHTFEDFTDSMKYSLDFSSAAVMSDYRSDSGGTLWHLTEKDKKKISDDVYSYFISDDGSAIAYVKDVDLDFHSGKLYLYNGTKSEKIADDIFYLIYQISPDGKSLAYIRDFDEESKEFTSYIKIGSKSPEKLGNNDLPLAISNKGKHIYYAKINGEEDADIYAKKGKTETRLRSKVSSNSVKLIFNQDYSQLIINDDGKSYISKNAGESSTIGNYEVRALMVADNTPMIQRWDMIQTKIYGVADFANILLYTDKETTVMLDKKAETTTVEKRHMHAIVSEDGKSMLYTDDRDRLYRRNLKNLDTDKVLVGEYVRQFVASPDLAVIYYSDRDDDLYYVKGNKKPKKIASDVYGHYGLILGPDGKTAYFLTDYRRDSGTLNTSTGGGKPKKVTDDVYRVERTPSGMLYAKDYSGGVYELYASKSGTKFELIGKDVSGHYVYTSGHFY